MSQFVSQLYPQQQQPATTKHNPYEELPPADCGFVNNVRISDTPQQTPLQTPQQTPQQGYLNSDRCDYTYDGGSSGDVSPQCFQARSPPQVYNVTENSSSVGNSTPAPQSPLHDTHILRNGIPPALSLGTPSVANFQPTQRLPEGTLQPFLVSPPQTTLDSNMFQQQYIHQDGGSTPQRGANVQQCYQPTSPQWNTVENTVNQYQQPVSPPQQYAAHVSPPQQYQSPDSNSLLQGLNQPMSQVPLPTAINPIPSQAPPLSLGTPSVGMNTPVNQHINAPLPAAIKTLNGGIQTPPSTTPPAQIQVSTPHNHNGNQVVSPVCAPLSPTNGMYLTSPTHISSPASQPLSPVNGSFNSLPNGCNAPMLSLNGPAVSCTPQVCNQPPPTQVIPQSQYTPTTESILPGSSYTNSVSPQPTPKQEAPAAPAPASKKKVRTNYPSCGGRKIFVGQLPKDVTRNDLINLLGSFGEIQDVKILHDKKTGQGTGAAFVVFKKPECAVAAVSEMDKKLQLDGMSTRIQLRLAEGEFDSSTDVKLFIGQIPTNTTEKDLEVVFDHPDLLECALLMKDGKSRGCAFVRYRSKEAAELAVSKLHGKLVLEGSQIPITVNFAFTEADKRRRGKTGGHTAHSGSSSGYSSPSSAGSLQNKKYR
eukprot:TRINITY_DN948_c1_g1_i1.p1 TRINITY_DN948_c1_g1~~TRINITY_DN948_c1_g1_i1.p1  ORF type:complete len:647 (+),score=138.22 TRINITY_DN948_c1_g1_i1:85-2025(+)